MTEPSNPIQDACDALDLVHSLITLGGKLNKSPVPLCKNCARFSMLGTPQCGAPGNQTMNYVNGEKQAIWPYAQNVRVDTTMCGPAGRWFEQRGRGDGMSFDTKCYDLAKVFLTDTDTREWATERHIVQLAQDIQDTIEDYIRI